MLRGPSDTKKRGAFKLSFLIPSSHPADMISPIKVAHNHACDTFPSRTGKLLKGNNVEDSLSDVITTAASKYIILHKK